MSSLLEEAGGPFTTICHLYCPGPDHVYLDGGGSNVVAYGVPFVPKFAECIYISICDVNICYVALTFVMCMALTCGAHICYVVFTFLM